MASASEPVEAGGAEQARPRDAAYWAKPIGRLSVASVPSGATGLNVAGRRVNGPMQGFGQMWQKSYRVRLSGASVSPAEVVRTWKEHFPRFWPKGNTFYAPLTGIAPGEIALVAVAPVPGPVKLSTGVLVLYADEESFTLMSPQGHVFAGWITFSAFEQGGATVAQAQALIRANDPMYELGMLLGGSRREDRFWAHTLRSLAAHFGVDQPVEIQATCVDRRRQWSRVGNIWHNAAIRSGLYATLAPLRWAARSFRRTTEPGGMSS
ncbi:MAG TPA: hypothetical protein VGM69_21095 [Chloroflexota bacterium]|jgi:hypothetical protein